jgi:PAS domain S-box-containing protein
MKRNILKEIAEANAFLEDIFQHLPVGVAVIKIDDGSVVMMNKIFSDICGWPQEMITDLTDFFFKIFPEKPYRDEITAKIQDDTASGHIDRMSWRGLKIATRTGEMRFVNIKNIPLHSSQNLMITTVTDVTENTLELQALESVKNDFQKIMDSSVDMIFSIDERDIILSVNAASERILGYEPEELIGKPLFDFIYPPDKEKTLRMVAKIKDGRKMTNVENHYVHKNGSIVPLIWSAVADNAEKIRYGIARDATEIKKSRAALVESERLYRYLFDNNPLPICIWDFKSHRFVECNEEFLKKYEYPKEELLRLTIDDIRPPEDLSLIARATRSEKAYGKRHHQVWRHKKKTGEIMYMDICGQLIDYNGRRVSIVVAQDITTLKKQHERLNEIAFINSHEIRRPVASILGLMPFFKQTTDQNPDAELLLHFEAAIKELDAIIKLIINKTYDS